MSHDSDPPRVILGAPCYGKRDDINAQRVYLQATQGTFAIVVPRCGGSLLARGFNTSWGYALASAENGEADYFAMLHDDIVPEPYWLDKLIPELHRSGADMLSVVVPLKDTSGVTSTAISDGDYQWRPLTRLTMRQIAELPETFTAADAGFPDQPLIVNTGCWVVDLRQEFWRETADDGVAKYYFTIRDRIWRRPQDRKWLVQTEPEDWFFSRLLHREGRVVKATTCVKLTHGGVYSNDGAWGTQETDTQVAAEWAEEQQVCHA